MSDTFVPMPFTDDPTFDSPLSVDLDGMLLQTDHLMRHALAFHRVLTHLFSDGLTLLASGIYLLKGLLDLESDRTDPAKRARASASGQVSIPLAAAFCLILLGVGFGLGLLCGWRFLLFAALLAFSVFFFFGLAMGKRYSELCGLAVQEGSTAVGRGYFRSDLEPIGTFGVASGMISVLVQVLYFGSAPALPAPNQVAFALPAFSLRDHAPLVQSQPRRSAAGTGRLRPDRSHQLHRGPARWDCSLRRHHLNH